MGSMQAGAPGAVLAGFIALEDLVHLRMADRFAAGIRLEILLRDIGDIFGLRVLREEMLERLVLGRADFLGDRLVPFVGVREGRIDVEHHAPERIEPVPHDLTDLEFGGPGFVDHAGSSLCGGMERLMISGCRLCQRGSRSNVTEPSSCGLSPYRLDRCRRGIG